MIAEMMDVESWERLAANAATEHEKNLATRNTLTRQRAAAALAGMMTGELDVTREIDEQLAALEARIVGHQQTMKLIRAGLEAATTVASSDTELEKIALTREAVQRRAELAAAVDAGLASLATVLTAYLDSNESAQRPDRAQGNIRRAFHHWFGKAGYRGRPTWWRQAITGMSEPTPIAQVCPLSSTVDPALSEADTLEAAALKRREEALAALKALTLPKPLPAAKTRQKRPVAAELEAA